DPSRTVVVSASLSGRLRAAALALGSRRARQRDGARDRLYILWHSGPEQPALTGAGDGTHARDAGRGFGRQPGPISRAHRAGELVPRHPAGRELHACALRSSHAAAAGAGATRRRGRHRTSAQPPEDVGTQPHLAPGGARRAQAVTGLSRQVVWGLVSVCACWGLRVTSVAVSPAMRAMVATITVSGCGKGMRSSWSSE